MLRRALEDVLTAEQAGQLYSAFDQIGDIIVIRIPDALLPKKEVIGRAILDRVKSAKTVLCQASDVAGDYRTREVELIAGQDRTETTYREYGCTYTVDVAGAFFSPRLSTERDRIAGLVSDGQTMVNLFGGIGIFSILAAKKTRCTVYSIDINPAASRLCEKNIKQNKLAGEVISINADAAEAAKDLGGISDHTLMLLPERSDEFLDSAIHVTRDGGCIHYYSHVSSQTKKGAPALSEAHIADVCPVPIEITHSRVVRAVGPRYYQTVVDITISKP